ncbi:MAG: TauD/TfdA family dioxygenase [Cyanobacteriota bacterium]|nr:TauD/TfdA family dioxygenase [Cyanobacteriota bacterium]
MSAERSAAIGWTAAELAADPHWVLQADAALGPAMAALTRWATGQRDPLDALVVPGASDAGPALGLLRHWCAPLLHQLEQGRGIARVTGLQHLEEGQVRLLFLAIGRLLGQPDRTYGLLYSVSDSGQSHLDRPIPVSQTRAATGMHTDSSQRTVHPRWVGLACVRPAASGGASAVASARAVHTHLLSTQPELVARLRRPFIRDVVTPGGDRRRAVIKANAFPIFAGSLEDPTLRYMRHWIETGQREAGQPLGPRDLADLDALDAALTSERFRHAFLLAPGDLLFVDNHRLAHDRTAYVDDPERPRLLLRLWVNAS